MIRCSLIVSSIFLLSLAGCLDTGKQEKSWYKGNLHTHSLWSDGDEYPEMIMKWYKDHGYNFVALSDHNILAEGEKWIEIKKGSNRERHFKEYLQEFGESRVTY